MHSRTTKGFTLVELLIVLSIMGLLIALVGPLTINTLDRISAKAELKRVEQWALEVSKKAYYTGTSYKLTLEQSTIKLQTISNNELLKKEQFEFLTFPKQTLNFSNKGFAAPSSISVTYLQQHVELDLNYSVNLALTQLIVEE